VSDPAGAGTGVFCLLGPVRLELPGRQIDLGPGKQRCLLTCLLLTPGQAVPVEALVDRIWSDRPPRQARNVLATYVTRLRRAVASAGPARTPATFTYTSGGYLADCDPRQVDLHRLRRLVRQARSAEDPQWAADRLHEVLASWQPVALAGVPGDWVARVRGDLHRERLGVLAEWAAVALRSGHASAVIDDLREPVGQYPDSEELVAPLMLALARSGRSADALGHYARLRQALAEHIGAEPSPRLRDLHIKILRESPDTTTVTAPAARIRAAAPGPKDGPKDGVPAQLPMDVVGFTGRAGHLTELDQLLAGTDQRQPGTVLISAIGGCAGVGKTALAVHWAHHVVDHFPGGQLYVDLRGHSTAAPMRPIDALAHLLYALGLPADQIPVDPDLAAGRYRTMLAGTRTLVLLDNAHTAEQVRPLLPGAPGCLVLVTSRDRLSGLTAREGARRMVLDTLTPDEAYALLSSALGAERVAQEPDATRALAQLCGGLPLALRIAAAHLIDHPQRPIAHQVAELDQGDRLSVLQIPGDPQTAVRATFDLSYRRLPLPARRLFRLLGLIPGPDLTVSAAAALTGEPPDAAAVLLDRLSEAHLVARPAPGRYALHDLLRDYAAECAAGEESATCRIAAVRRLLDWYLHTADAAARLLYPHMLRLDIPPSAPGLPAARFDDHAAALAWLTAERANLVAAVQHATSHGPHPAAWLLADTLRGYFWQCRQTVDWLRVAGDGVAAAAADGDGMAEAALRHSLGMAYHCQIRQADAIEQYTMAAELAQRAGWLAGQAGIAGNLGLVYHDMGNLPLAAESYRQALALYRRTGWLPGQGVALGNLGAVHRQLGQLSQAAAHHCEALDLYRRTGSRGGEADALANLGCVHHALGRLDQALAQFTEAVSLQQQVGSRYGEAETLSDLAALHRDASRHAQAQATAHAALDLAREIGQGRTQANALTVLGTIHLGLGHTGEAAGYHLDALRMARSARARYRETEALIGLADAYCQQGRHAEATRRATDALALAHQAGYRVLEGQARTSLATVHLAIGRADLASAQAGRALIIYRGTGHRIGEAITLATLAQVASRAADPDTAEAYWREACLILAGSGADVALAGRCPKP
jgi:DNA-binding SARP family transcriptional activator/tetratricopeptide (TPR) repeat protein